MARQRILLVGGGYIGLYAARRLERLLKGTDHVLTLVNPESFMQYQPFLPEVAGGTIDPRAVVVPLRRVLRRTELVVGEVTRIDHEVKAATVRLSSGDDRVYPYDHVVIGPGSRSRVLPIPGLAEHAVGFKTVQEAIYLRNRVLSRLDVAAELEPGSRRRGAALTFVFVGAGYAGIEALGELEDLARAACTLYPTITREDMRWVMVEAADRILPELGDDLASYARERLEERRIEILTNTRLDAIEAGVVLLSDGQRFGAETIVWTAGVKPSPLARDSGLPVDEAGRLVVEPTLEVRGIEGAWGAGDAAAVPDLARGGSHPPSAQHALRQAKRLAANLVARLQGREPEPFRYTSKGGLASLGHYRGIADPLGIKLRGFPAWFLHRTYHLLYMPTLQRKVRIAMDWTVALLFPRDVAQLGSLERPREPFERAAGE